MSDLLVVYVTVPDLLTGERIARTLVEEELAACCNLVPQVRSIYRWKGETEQSDEVLMIIKTRAERWSALNTRVVALHPYELPEVIALPIQAGHAPYLAWVRSGSGG